MKFLLLTAALLALGVPAAASASHLDPADGTLSVRDGRGSFTITARGGVIGSFVRGRVIITDPVGGDGTGPIVSGDDWHRDRSDTTTVFGGTRVRFRLIGGTFKIRVVGTGVNLSVVGRGAVTLNGQGTDDDGSYSLNGAEYASVPNFAQFPLTAVTP
jgi:opacity protein-like surface antigen